LRIGLGRASFRSRKVVEMLKKTEKVGNSRGRASVCDRTPPFAKQTNG